MRKEPAKLLPAVVPKPWGHEIWHSAIEVRGESRVLTSQGEMPLSAYLEAVGIRRPVILLKQLDPVPTPIAGDLYFEVHAKKQEVYVVTAIDADAWPDGQGQIRLGMNQALRRSYSSDAAFRASYLEAVQRYEQVRRAIDAGEAGLKRKEQRHRLAMEQFTALAPLRVGDVVVLLPWTPHALQHGVRVVEFQTPTYERHIISFAQKVLTQDHWDSKTAVARMNLEAPPKPRFKSVAPGVELIASFAGFGVWRMSLAAGRQVSLPKDAPYALCIAVQGTLQLGALRLKPEEACFITADGLGRHQLRAHDEAQCLLAAPGL